MPADTSHRPQWHSGQFEVIVYVLSINCCITVMSKRKSNPVSESRFMEKWMSKQPKTDALISGQPAVASASDAVSEPDGVLGVIDVTASADEVLPPNNDGEVSRETRKASCTSYEKHNWITKVPEGYVCSVCLEFGLRRQGDDNVWTTKPVPLLASRKLYSKAAKHANSNLHKAAVMAKKQQQGPDVVARITVAANDAAVADADCMKLLFKGAHYMFLSEIPHTTHWRNLISTTAACDLSGRLRKFLTNCPANAHHLSSTTVTAILEAFGDAMQSSLCCRVANVNEFAVMADECADVNGIEKLSLCVRFLEGMTITELFLGCWSLQSTKANDVHECIVSHLRQFGLSPDHLVSAAFDGASNMSGKHGGVQALLKKAAPSLIFVHCRSHLLQLALVRASATVTEMKQVLSSLTSLYSLFSRSPVRLSILKQTQVMIDGMSHKLVQPGSTRWLSYDGSVTVVLKHYAAICLALEAIYADAGDLSSVAGGLLLTFRKSSTLLFLLVLQHFLQPLARLSKTLQSSDSNIAAAMTVAKATIASLRDDFSFSAIQTTFTEQRASAVAAGVNFVNEDFSDKQKESVCTKYHKVVISNLENRFSDDVSSLAEVNNSSKFS